MIKRHAAQGLQKGNHHAITDIDPKRSFLIHGGNDRFPLTRETEAIGLRELAEELVAL